MKDRWQQLPWWQRGALAFLLAAGVYALTLDGTLPIIVAISAALATLATIAGVILQAWNPFEPRPKPHLTLQPIDGEETTNVTITAVRRRVDVDTLVDDCVTTTRELAKSAGFRLIAGSVNPTQDDLVKFEQALATYADDLRAWAQESDAWLQARAAAFVADVVQHNPTSVDAIDAGIHLFFPPDTVQYEDTDPPEQPDAPRFPRPRAAWDYQHSLYEPPAMFQPQLVTTVRPDLDRIRFPSPGAPDYEKTRDGRLEAFYGRWIIRHRESRTAGDEPLSLTLPVGEHQVPWEVRATNLPHHAKGTWTLSVQVDDSNPITTVQQLDDALHGRPEFSMADRRAALKKLLRDRHDDSDRSDSATAAQ